MKYLTSWANSLSLIGLFIVLVSFYIHPIGFINEDLPRHIKNGQLIWKTKSVPSTNLYSYTFPDHQTYMHHWGAGVIFYFLVESIGFEGFQVVMIGLTLLSFGIMVRLSIEEFGYSIGSFVSLLSMLIFVSRTQMRPESFSYLFIAFCVYILWQFNQGKLARIWLWSLVPVFILWINLHVFFVFGLGIIGVFILECLVQKKWQTAKQISLVGLVSLIAMVLNPYGIKGVLAPITVVTESQSRIVENLPLLTLLKHFDYPNLKLFLGILGIIGFVLAYLWKTQPKTNNLVTITLLSLSFGYFSLSMNRLTVMFSLIMPLLLGYVVYQWLQTLSQKTQKQIQQLIQKSTWSLLALSLVLILYNYEQLKWSNLGVDAKDSLPAEFIKTNQLKGPILNNFNSGSYLIYYLYPEYRVFIDNRSEAYPDSFILNDYQYIETDDKIFKRLDEQYKFNLIFGEIDSLKPEWLEFLTWRKDDPQWALVYQDKKAVIFLRRNEQNQELIEKFEIEVK